MDGSPYGWPRRRAGGTIRAIDGELVVRGLALSGPSFPVEPPMAVLTRPEDWHPAARRILWPERA